MCKIGWNRMPNSEVIGAPRIGGSRPPAAAAPLSASLPLPASRSGGNGALGAAGRRGGGSASSLLKQRKPPSPMTKA